MCQHKASEGGAKGHHFDCLRCGRKFVFVFKKIMDVEAKFKKGESGNGDAKNHPIAKRLFHKKQSNTVEDVDQTAGADHDSDDVIKFLLPLKIGVAIFETQNPCCAKTKTENGIEPNEKGRSHKSEDQF